MATFRPDHSGLAAFNRLLMSAVCPRPIAFVSTISCRGVRNLSPFSYFNLVSANPPVLLFSVMDTGEVEQKDTLQNIREIGHAVVHIIDRSLADQMNLASSPFESDVDEFERAGLTPIRSDSVGADRVQEAKVAIECALKELVPLGRGRGAGVLVIMDVLALHIEDAILSIDQTGIDPRKFEALARLGDSYYASLAPEDLFELPRPTEKNALGLSGAIAALGGQGELETWELARLGLVGALPDDLDVETYLASVDVPTNDSSAVSEFLRGQMRVALERFQLHDAWTSALAAKRLGYLADVS